jgi:hypothetical protein
MEVAPSNGEQRRWFASLWTPQPRCATLQTLQMKRRIIATLLVVTIVVVALLVAKLTIPLSYADVPIRQEAVSYIVLLQERGERDPKVIATRYFYFGSDYQKAQPDRIEVSAKDLKRNEVRVRIFDPSCDDDSVSSSIHRVYLRRMDSGFWMPVRVDWSHRGRGRFGWTTQPTT